MNARFAGILLALAAVAVVLAAPHPAKAGSLLTPERPLVKLATTEGDIVMQLYPEHAPESVENFLRYAREGFYDGTIFHRVEKRFVIQGGGLTPDLKEKDVWLPIKNESDNDLKNLEYTVAMARKDDPDSATSQFYINLRDNPSLDRQGDRKGQEGYAVFGRVVKGESVVERISRVAVWKKGPHPKLPVRPVVIEKARVVSEVPR
ncbi:MAG: peptidylprolyl isomerase [Desulfovibrionaceae bacterium]